MNFELIFTIAVVVATVVLFVSERLPLATTSVLAMCALGLAGVITPEQAFEGFANSAIVTVTAMFVLSAAMHRTGGMTSIGRMIGRLFERSWKAGLSALMLGAATMSAFINNTAVVAVLIPVVMRETRRHDLSPSKVLIPLSFASMFGGSCTLIGTSTNLLVSSVAAELGQPRIGIFELSPVGLVLAIAGLLYLILFGPRLLPDTKAKSSELADDFEVSDYVTDLTICAGAPTIGEPISQVPFLADRECEVIAIMREGVQNALPPESTVLQEGDTLRVRANIEDLRALQQREFLELARVRRKREAVADDTMLVEAIVGPNSNLAGKSLEELDLRHRVGAVVLAVRHEGDLSRRSLGDLVVKPGNALLLEASKERVDELRQSEDFVVISEVDTQARRQDKLPFALLILLAVIASASSGLVPIAVAATSGALGMVLLGCLRQEEAFEAIDWNVVFLLGGLFCMGTAVQTSGLADLVGDWIVEASKVFGSTGLIAVTFGITALLSSFLSNNGTAVLLTPIAIAAAEASGVDPRPLMMAVVFGASTSFATPVGYQTNTLVYSAGDYRFVDFLRVGVPLTAVFAVVATLLIPVFWPLHP